MVSKIADCGGAKRRYDPEFKRSRWFSRMIDVGRVPLAIGNIANEKARHRLLDAGLRRGTFDS